MKKNELVHFHALLVHVARDLVDRGVVAFEELEPYLALGVTPTSLREPRERHQEAVFALAGILADASSRAAPPVVTGTDEEPADAPGTGSGADAPVATGTEAEAEADADATAADTDAHAPSDADAPRARQ